MTESLGLRFLKYLRYELLDGYGVRSYSQEGEDLILQRIFSRQGSGFYVDVGAHHPKRFSNTYYFYRRGWRGLNIDPNPEAIRLFNRHRPRDISLEMGISDSAGTLTYYMFNDPALNTFDEMLAADKERNTRYRIMDRRPVQVARLDDVLSGHLPAGTRIDFMSIDAEGFDERVVQSNDWRRYRPSCLLVELLHSDIESVLRSPIHRYLSDREYSLFAKTFNTLFYLDKTAPWAGLLGMGPA